MSLPTAAPSPEAGDHERIWWKEATFYQIYPASFRSSNGSSIGNIPGILEKIDYLASLGIDVVWISPMYDSPQIDMGYDISNYEAVYAPYGTVADMDALISACHARGLKIILDLVVNHTSDQHAWFQESRSSKDNPKRDWYFWRPARYDEAGNRQPPTNYRSYFGGGTWTWDEGTQEYYLHLYSPSQPDLNWDNAACRAAIYESAMRFWLDRGIDGFRIDTVNKYSKHVPFTDAPVTDPTSPFQPAAHKWCNGPRIHTHIREMAGVLSAYTTRCGAPLVTVGELAECSEPASVLPYISAAAHELSMVFQFDLMHLGQGAAGSGAKYIPTPWRLPDLKRIVDKWQRSVDGTDGWTTVFAENHDNGRSVSRFACDAPRWRAESGKMLALWLGALTGSLFLYQGQEIGMVNAPATWDMDEYKDVEGRNVWAEAQACGDPVREEEIKKGLQLMARDHARLPVQWDDSPNAGFSAGGRPWMRVHDDYRVLNVAAQENDPESVLAFWKRVLRVRKEHKDVFVYGAFELLDEENEKTFAYRKRVGEKEALVVLNFTTEEQGMPSVEEMELLVSSCAAPLTTTERLRPLEGRIYVNY